MGQSKKKKGVTGSVMSTPAGGEVAHWGPGFKLLLLILAVAVGKANHHHVSTLFENDRHFSHLSNLEREMTFRTEMGMYYSYFKSFIHADSINDGVLKLYRNNMTEFPLVINTLKRFNLYPELFIGILYRGLNNLGLLSETCWTVSRGDDLEPVQSCEGLKDPPHFYLSVVWVSAGLTVSLLFLLSVFLSDSVLAGMLTVACFFFNHGECTRVMWTPPLRESFAFPICLMQILSVTVSLGNPRPGWRNIASIAVSTSAFILCWQFAQFMLFTQSTVIFGLFILGCVPRDTMSSIVTSLLIGLLHAVAMMFGNEMLFCSWFFSSLASCLVLSLLLYSTLCKIPALVRVPIQGLLYLLLTVALKVGLSKLLLVQDDAHVLEIFKSKFTDFKNFNTQLYTCAAEFDFLGWEMPAKISLTLLLPAAILAVILVIVRIVRSLCFKGEGKREGVELPSPAELYTVLQAVAYAIMAVLIMRLKLFLTPHLCLLVGLLASSRLVNLFISRQLHTALLVALLAAMSFQGIQNIQEQRQIIGEYSDPYLEEMFEWVMKNTPQNAVFAGPMPTMANLLLSTERPIVNHPHYEDVGSRERTKKVYSIYSRRNPEDPYRTLREMKVDYLVLSRSWCLNVERDGCAMPELWDLEEKENSKRPPLCPILWKNPRPFLRVFSNPEYQVLQLSPNLLHLNTQTSRPE